MSGPGGGAIQIDAGDLSDLEVARRSAFAITRVLMMLPAPPGDDDEPKT